MRIKLIGDNIKITKKIRQLVKNKIAKDLEKYLPGLNNQIKTADMTISRHSRWGYKVNFDLRLPNKKHFYADSHQDKLLLALTDLRDKIIRQIKKYRQQVNIDKPS